MANMKCMHCHYKKPLRGLSPSIVTTCPKCNSDWFVGPETAVGRRMKLQEISQKVRDASTVAMVIVLAMLNAKYSASEFEGTVMHRVFSPLTPPVLVCLALAWLQRYVARFWRIVKGKRLMYCVDSPSGLKRFSWICGSIIVVVLMFLGYKADVWPFSVLGNFIAAFIASDVAVGSALMLFLAQQHFNPSEDYMVYICYSRERPGEWCTDLPAPLEITQCYAVCILLTLTGLMIACGPDWFAGTKFGEFLGTCHGFFESLYGLFGGLLKAAAGLIIGIFNFIF